MATTTLVASILAASSLLRTSAAGSSDICVTGVTFTGFSVNDALNGDFIGDGRTDRISASHLYKDGAGPENFRNVWITYESPERTGAPYTHWSMKGRATKNMREIVDLAWCVPGEGGCPEGVPSTNDAGRIWPADALTMQWNVVDFADGNVTKVDSAVHASCCAWQHDPCDDCKCSSAHLFESWCKAGCGEECCSWSCDVVTGVLCGCSQRGPARHCQHDDMGIMQDALTTAEEVAII